MIMERKYFVGRIECEELKERIFAMEYYVVEYMNMYSIEIVKEAVANCGMVEDNERITSYPISHTRKVAERIASLFLRNAVTPMGMYECLDDIFEI